VLDLVPLGERAFLARFASASEARGWALAVRNQGWPGVVDVNAAYQTAAVFADSDRIDLDDLEGRLRSLVAGPDDLPPGKLITLPVLYDGEDLADVAGRLGLSVNQVIAAHSGLEYHVGAIGFMPGFPYAGPLPDVLSGLPRRDQPRPRVPTGSVAIVGRQSGIYPAASPGGWHLLGRTPIKIVDLQRAYFPIRVGDRLRFAPISEAEFEQLIRG
jgi:KipI family sensor histidine kinase inhibitor